MTRFLKNNIFWLMQTKQLKPYRSFLHAAPTMTSSITFPSSFNSIMPSAVPKINVIDTMNNLKELISSFKITNDDIVRVDLNKTAFDCLHKSLEIVKNTYTAKKYSLATEQISRLVSILENIYGDTSKSESPTLKNLAIEIYTLQGKIYEYGTLDQAEVALKAFKKAIKIDPNNSEAVENYENLALELGIDVSEENSSPKPKR